MRGGRSSAPLGGAVVALYARRGEHRVIEAGPPVRGAAEGGAGPRARAKVRRRLQRRRRARHALTVGGAVAWAEREARELPDRHEEERGLLGPPRACSRQANARRCRGSRWSEARGFEAAAVRTLRRGFEQVSHSHFPQPLVVRLPTELAEAGAQLPHPREVERVALVQIEGRHHRQALGARRLAQGGRARKRASPGCNRYAWSVSSTRMAPSVCENLLERVQPTCWCSAASGHRRWRLHRHTLCEIRDGAQCRWSA